MMRSLRFIAFGPPSVLRLEQVAVPEPGEGEALVRVKHAAINPSDIGNVAGRFKNTTLPRTPGRDFAGIVVKGSHHEGAEVWGSSLTSVSRAMDRMPNTSFSRRKRRRSSIGTAMAITLELLAARLHIGQADV